MKSVTLTPRAQANVKLDQWRQLKNLLATKVVERDTAVAEIDKEYGPSIGSMEEELETLEFELRGWAKENRDAEFGDEKTLTFASRAKIQFRLGNKSVTLAEGKTEEKVIEKLEEQGLHDLVSVTKSLNKSVVAGLYGTDSLPLAVAKKIGIRVEQAENVLLIAPSKASKEQA